MESEDNIKLIKGLSLTRPLGVCVSPRQADRESLLEAAALSSGMLHRSAYC